MDIHSIETEAGEIIIEDLSDDDIKAISELCAGILRQGEIQCPYKAYLCAFIRWVDLVVFINEPKGDTDCIQ